MPEKALTEWKAIAEFFGWSVSKTIGKKQELESEGVIFYSRIGRPPEKRVQAFPSMLRDWATRKSIKKEVL